MLEGSVRALSEYEKDTSDWNQIMLLRAIVLYRLGRTAEAAAEFKHAMEVDPKFTQAKWREIFFYSDPSISEREVADLASLGLPEK